MVLAAVYFDLDGTLVDSEYLHALSWNNVLSEYDIHYSEDAFCQAFAGKPTLEAAKTLVNEHDLTISPTVLAEKKHQVFAQISQQELPVLLPGARQLLGWCREQGLKVALVTGSAKAEAAAILAGHNLKAYFDVIVTRDDVINAKPHPEPYLSAMAYFELSAASGMAIEDTITGSKSAVAAQLPTVVVPNKYSQGGDFSHTSQLCNSLDDVKALIASKLG